MAASPLSHGDVRSHVPALPARIAFRLTADLSPPPAVDPDRLVAWVCLTGLAVLPVLLNLQGGAA